MFLHGAKTGGGSTNPVAQLTHSSPKDHYPNHAQKLHQVTHNVTRIAHFVWGVNEGVSSTISSLWCNYDSCYVCLIIKGDKVIINYY